MMAESITHICSLFSPISLEEMDRVKLMDRTDTKFVFHIAELSELLQSIRQDYFILDIKGHRVHAYETLYLDTVDFDLFRNHHNGKLNRYKIRYRNYKESALAFFEIKFKNNKGRTIKKRVKIKTELGVMNASTEELLHSITPFSSKQLEPKLWVNYSRITFVGKKNTERITIDLNLHFFKPEDPNAISEFPQMVIAEVKQEKAQHDSPFIRELRKRNIREAGISKYCYGVFHFFDEVKKNNFKPIIRFIHKCASERAFNLAG